MEIWIVLHIISMFAAITLVFGSQVWATHAIRTRDLGSLRAYFRISSKADNLGGVLLLVGIAFGLIAAMVSGFDLLQGWLVVAYVLVGLTLVIGFATVPYLGKLKAALAANEGDEAGPDLEKLLASPIPLIATALGIVIVGAIIWDMVTKPEF